MAKVSNAAFYTSRTGAILDYDEEAVIDGSTRDRWISFMSMTDLITCHMLQFPGTHESVPTLI